MNWKTRITKLTPLKNLIENIMKEAEEILNSWGFTKEELNILPK